MANAKFTRYGPFTGIPALNKKGKRIIGAAPCQTSRCGQEVNICIGADNWLTSTCPQTGCGTTIHGRTVTRARHELDRLKASRKVAHEDTLDLCYAALDAMENKAPEPEPSDQLSFVTARAEAQSQTTAADSKPEPVKAPVSKTANPAKEPKQKTETDDPLADFMEDV